MSSGALWVDAATNGALFGAAIGYFVGAEGAVVAGAVAGCIGGGYGGVVVTSAAVRFSRPFIAQRWMAVYCPILGSTVSAVTVALIWYSSVGVENVWGKIWFVVLCSGSAMIGCRVASYWRFRLSYAIDTPIRSALNTDSPSVVEWVRQAARLIGRDETIAVEEYVKEVRSSEPSIVPIIQVFEQLRNTPAAAVPFLVASLKHPNVFVRSGAASSLGTIGAGAKEAVPALIESMGDVFQVRAEAAEALGSIGTGVDRVLPRLIVALSDEHVEVRSRACAGLQKLGSEAKPAIPALRALVDSASWTVRDSARRALSVIEPGHRGSSTGQNTESEPVPFSDATATGGALGTIATSTRMAVHAEAPIEASPNRERRATVHCRYCGQRYLTTVVAEKCSLCGKSGGVAVVDKTSKRVH